MPPMLYLPIYTCIRADFLTPLLERVLFQTVSLHRYFAVHQNIYARMPRSRSKSAAQRRKESRERMQTKRASERPQETEDRQAADTARYDDLLIHNYMTYFGL